MLTRQGAVVRRHRAPLFWLISSEGRSQRSVALLSDPRKRAGQVSCSTTSAGRRGIPRALFFEQRTSFYSQTRSAALARRLVVVVTGGRVFVVNTGRLVYGWVSFRMEECAIPRRLGCRNRRDFSLVRLRVADRLHINHRNKLSDIVHIHHDRAVRVGSATQVQRKLGDG